VFLGASTNQEQQNQYGTDTPIAQRSIHPTLPFSFSNIGVLFNASLIVLRCDESAAATHSTQ